MARQHEILWNDKNIQHLAGISVYATRKKDDSWEYVGRVIYMLAWPSFPTPFWKPIQRRLEIIALVILIAMFNRGCDGFY